MLFVLSLLAACSESPKSLEEMVDTFLAEEDLSPTGCGAVDYSQACDADGEAAVECLAAALETCSPARLDAVYSTVEGAPIYATFIVWMDGENCIIEQFRDSSEDEFAEQDEILTESVCYDGEVVQQEETCDMVSMDCYSACDDGTDCG